jgi:tRNA 2-selenouridine synthase
LMENRATIWIENESRFIGRLRIPDTFFDQSNKAGIICINRDIQFRAERILSEYGSFDRQVLAEKTRSITKRMGGDRVKASVEALEAGDMMGWLLPLLDYYDRNYEHSTKMREGKHEEIIHVTSETPADIAQELLLPAAQRIMSKWNN